eukprot:SAG11_NODE_23020_length_396_cov_1.040404_1_plen_45_part_01
MFPSIMQLLWCLGTASTHLRALAFIDVGKYSVGPLVLISWAKIEQ